MTLDPEESPNLIPWPPLLFVGTLASGLLLETILPSSQIIGALPATLRLAGIAILGIGLAGDIWAMMTMARAKTNILPHRAADHLISTGPFAYSRNPIYLSNVVILIGAGLAFNNLWLIVAAFLFAILVNKLAIKREEAHLAAKFGDEWQAYKNKVPRWLFGV